MPEFFDGLRKKMVEEQLLARGITESNVLEAFLSVPRHLFVEEHLWFDAYNDYPLPIGFNQTISQPYIVALMTQALKLSSQDIVLEIGTGSGYQTAILSRIAYHVYTIEVIFPLLEKAQKLLKHLGCENITFSCFDGKKGWPDFLEFDAILVAAATKEIPNQLLKQLKNGGKMIIPLGNSFFQSLYLIKKESHDLIKTHICDCRFVPLV